MPSFGRRSTRRLGDCHIDLVRLFEKVVKDYDCTILTGHRNEIDQNVAYDSDRSKLRFPDGKHNALPSNAVDAAPYPVPKDWGRIAMPDGITHEQKADLLKSIKELARFYHFSGYVSGVASEMGLEIREGADWDGDHEFNDQKFDDLVHFELRGSAPGKKGA